MLLQLLRRKLKNKLMVQGVLQDLKLIPTSWSPLMYKMQSTDGHQLGKLSHLLPTIHKPPPQLLRIDSTQVMMVQLKNLKPLLMLVMVVQLMMLPQLVHNSVGPHQEHSKLVDGQLQQLVQQITAETTLLFGLNKVPAKSPP